ncbi:hypothetical protein RFI_28967 [Reticulomyxa filosa]|uniref:Uncharacterized protein n=1 Tax=Reticulomyxa filosa TaxID=46433 RepID=X6M493_RETFI|nr:hypothetical protein RFI_28967 [Reticulomyxa filosa]|eukprot:ETO08421.1 hypothetical protein RFI_28967 [Reticulomyxa filosa]
MKDVRKCLTEKKDLFMSEDIDDDCVMEDSQEMIRVEKVRSIIRSVRTNNLHVSIKAIISSLDPNAHEIRSFDPFVFYNGKIGLFIDNTKRCLTYEHYYEDVMEYGATPKQLKKLLIITGRPRTEAVVERAMLVTICDKWEIERRDTVTSKFCQKRVEKVYAFTFTPVTENVEEFSSGDLLKDVKLLEILESTLDKYIGWVLHIANMDKTGMLKFKLLHLLHQLSVYSEYQYWTAIIGDYPLKECIVQRLVYDDESDKFLDRNYKVTVFNYTSAYCDSFNHLFESSKEFENHHVKGHCKEYYEAKNIIRMSYRMIDQKMYSN